MFFKSLDQDLDVVEDVGVVTSGIFQDGASNITFLPEIVTDLRSNKGSVPQSKPGDSRLSTNTSLETTHGINHFISEFNVITELGEKV